MAENQYQTTHPHIDKAFTCITRQIRILDVPQRRQAQLQVFIRAMTGQHKTTTSTNRSTKNMAPLRFPND